MVLFEGHDTQWSFMKMVVLILEVEEDNDPSFPAGPLLPALSS